MSMIVLLRYSLLNLGFIFSGCLYGQLPTALDVPAIIQSTASASPQQAIFHGPEKASRPWRLCVVLPNVSDKFWADISNGVRTESARLGVSSVIFEASGYTDAAFKQQERILNQRCGNGMLDAVLLAAVYNHGFNDSLRRLRTQKVLVIDFINGYDPAEVDAHALLDNYYLGKTAGESVLAYLPKLVRKQPGKWRILWIPGPQGPEWVARGDQGFKAALQPGIANIQLDTAYLQAHYRIQAREIPKYVSSKGGYDLIVGTGPTTLAVQQLKQDGQLAKDLPVFAYYTNPDVAELLASGQVLNAVTNEPELQGRIGVALAVGMLEKQAMPYQVGPLPHLVRPIPKD